MDRYLYRSLSVVLLIMITLLPGCAAEQQAAQTIVLAGDIMAGRGLSGLKEEEWKCITALLQTETAGAELFVFNLESPLEKNHVEMHDMDLTADSHFLDCFPDDVLIAATTANNHALDNGTEGLKLTVSELEERGIFPAGAFGSLTRFHTDGGMDGIIAAFNAVQDSETDFEIFLEQLAPCRTEFCLVSIHWGEEYMTVPDREQQEWAQRIAEQGVEILLGHHPHVLQRVEWIDTGSGRMLVAYSMGNLLFDMTLPDTRRTALLRLDMWNDEVIDVCAVPLSIVPGWRLEEAYGREEKAILDRLELRSCAEDDW